MLILIHSAKEFLVGWVDSALHCSNDKIPIRIKDRIAFDITVVEHESNTDLILVKVLGRPVQVSIVSQLCDVWLTSASLHGSQSTSILLAWGIAASVFAPRRQILRR